MDHCPICNRPYTASIKRCYYCKPKPKTGENRTCPICGIVFYAAPWQLRDTARKQGTYCSKACKDTALQTLMQGPRKDQVIHSGGYVLVWAPDHPRSSRGRVLEHILVAERKLGRPLRDGETVHHIDKDKTNNDPANLRILSNSEHATLHADERHPLVEASRVQLKCPECGTEYRVKPSRGPNGKARNQRKYCSRECRLTALHRACSAYHQRKREEKAATTT